VVDTRGALLQRIEKAMTLEDARDVLRGCRHIMAVHGTGGRPPGMLESAMVMIRDQPDLTQNDQWLLAEAALEIGEYDHAWPFASAVFNHLRPNSLIRRRFYSHDIEAIEKKRREHRYWLHAL